MKKIYIITLLSFLSLAALFGRNHAKLQSNKQGDYYLNVPMLKERSPADCVAVSVKRIFDYYKAVPAYKSWSRIARHLKLKVHSPMGLKRIYARVAQQCRCDVRRLVDVDDFDNFNSIMSFLKKYNDNAQRMRKPKLDSFEDNSFASLISTMNESVLVATCDNRGQVERFKQVVCEQLRIGKPVLWIMFLGVVKESPKALSPAGGHARLILGYNPKENKVIYSDNWGEGHGYKKMTWKQAWAITLSAMVISPRRY